MRAWHCVYSADTPLVVRTSVHSVCVSVLCMVAAIGGKAMSFSFVFIVPIAYVHENAKENSCRS